jgi:hypothetical protein
MPPTESATYVTFVDPTPERGVFAFARIAEVLGRLRPDIPLLVVEGLATEQDLADCGIDLRPFGNVVIMGATDDPGDYWSVTRACLVPSLVGVGSATVAARAMALGIPVVASDRGGMPGALRGAGIVLPLPDRLTPEARELPTAEEVDPWVEAVIRLWDDAEFREEHHRRALASASRPSAAEGPGDSPRPGGPSLPSIESGIAAIKRRWPELENRSEDDPIFVLSAGWRSGSTMLQRLIVRSCFLWGEPFGHSALIDSLAGPIRCFQDRWPEAHHFYRGADAEELSRRFIANLYPPIQDLLRAHQEYFHRLFAEPARRAGASRWGFKEVRLGVDHATYLRWLYPRSKFLLLIRDPYDAWKSYAARAAKGWKWYLRWPDQPVTARSFAEHWRDLTTSFLDGHGKVDGLVVRYERLKRGEYAPIEEYLGFPLAEEAGRVNPSDGGPPPLEEIPPADLAVFEECLGPLAESLGYRPRAGRPRSRPEPLGPGRGPLLGPVEAAAVHPAPAPATVTVDRLDPSRCVILVPVGGHVEHACDEALRALERKGYTVRRVRGYSAIDQGRNQIATNALRDGFEELMWIDSDVAFEPDAVDRLRSHGLPITCGVYPKKGKRAFACNFPGGLKQVVFGHNGGLVEIPYAGAGFLHTRAEVYREVQRRLRMPSCNERFGPSMTPYFQPLVVPDGDGHWYLAEDFAFCHRARDCGFRIMADTTIRLKHIGSYSFSWEDAGGERPRYANFSFRFTE